MKNIIVFVMCLLLASVAWSDPQTVAVRGHGKISIDPDIIEIQFSVGNTQFKDIEAAKEDVEQRASAIAKALKKLGVSEDDISSPRFEVNAQRHQRFGDKCEEEWYPTVTRYIQFTLRDVKKYGKVLDVLVKNGMTTMQNISPSVADDAPHHRKALAKAIEDAKSQAAFLAESFDTKISGIHLIGDRQVQNRFMMNESLAMSARDSSVPKSDSPYEFKPGKVDIEADIYVEFKLAP